jgi:hypothetical protein
MNFRVIAYYTKEKPYPEMAGRYLVPAIAGARRGAARQAARTREEGLIARDVPGFFRSIALQNKGAASALQDILR